MARKLTAKQERLVDEYCSNGWNGTQAVRDAGYKVSNANTAAAIASENLRKPKIVAAIEKRKNALARRRQVTIERQLHEYERVKDAAMESGQYNAAIHALDSQTRIIGGFEKDNAQQADKLPFDVALAVVLKERRNDTRDVIDAEPLDTELTA